MRGDGPAGKGRAPLARVVTDGDDEIKTNVAEIVPGLAHRAGGINFEVFAENFQDERVDFPLRRFATTVDLEAIGTHRAKEIFGEDAAVGVAGAEKEDAEFWAHDGEVCQTDTRGLNACSSKVVTKLSQSCLWRFAINRLIYRRTHEPLMKFTSLITIGAIVSAIFATSATRPTALRRRRFFSRAALSTLGR